MEFSDSRQSFTIEPLRRIENARLATQVTFLGRPAEVQLHLGSQGWDRTNQRPTDPVRAQVQFNVSERRETPTQTDPSPEERLPRPNFLFSTPRSRVITLPGRMQLSTRVLPRNSNFEPTQASANQDSEPNIAPSFDPEELQRLFWRDIFSLDIWNLERSVGSVQSLIYHFETAFSV